MHEAAVRMRRVYVWDSTNYIKQWLCFCFTETLQRREGEAEAHYQALPVSACWGALLSGRQNTESESEASSLITRFPALYGWVIFKES